MTILEQLSTSLVLRIVIALLATAALIVLVRYSGAALAKLIAAGDAVQRVAAARRIVLVGACAAAVLVLGANIANPVGTTRGILLGAGAGIGPFVPMFFATRFSSRTPASPASRPAESKPYWLWAACAVTILMWFVYGPGITLS